ncbi:NAD(P)-binding protein [Calocera viscosa TUFC12733]|uniref:NAD(P)-binding protein n=1 Tax=Calocera viscosa (strain TUFC12733) TaxID=1330018 RepID=A0A167HFB7_CALVF|nr:NAD(P)-binding protein [Calocera viscosa TUFC12733]
MSRMPVVLVTGATGAQGGAVLTELLKGNKVTVRAMTRDTSSPAAQTLASGGVQVVKGDMEDGASLRKALSGCDRAFLVTTWTGPKGAVGEAELGIQFVDSAKAAGVQHVVFTSVCNANTPEGADVPHFASKRRIEERLISSGIPSWTFVRPVAFMDSMVPIEGGMQRALLLAMLRAGVGNTPIKLIAVKDIGWFAARALESPEEWNGKELDIAGDDLNLAQVQEVYRKVQGRKMWSAWMPSGVIGLMPKELSSMLRFFKEHGFDADISAVRKTHPGLMDLEMYLRDKVKGKSS